MRFYFSLGFDGGEKLRGHHFHSTLDHSLTDARNSPAYLHVTFVTDNRRLVALFQIDIA